MISLGQILGRAIIALWRRRLPVLGLTSAWLVLDGLMLGALSGHDPTLWLGLPLELVQFLYSDALLAGLLQILLLLPIEYLHDLIRAVLVVLLLWTLLAPLPGGRRRVSDLALPILLVLVFEFAWTTALFPIDHGLLHLAVGAESAGTIDAATMAYALQSVKIVLFAGYALAMSRFCFAYPNAVLRRGLLLERSWHETRGLSTRLFLLLLLIPVPFVVLRTLLTMALFQYEFTMETRHLLQLSMELLNSLQEVPTAVLSLAVIAVAYVAVTGHAAAAIPGGARSPQQLAEAFE